MDSQAFTVPLIAPGAPGLTKRTNRSLGLETPQLDTDTTRTLPKLNALENVICTDVLPWPDVICAPLGAVHSYDVTPATGEMVYVTAMFWPTNSQILVGPLMGPGKAGNTFLTAITLGWLMVQGPALTLIVSTLGYVLSNNTLMAVVV
jgi:hypothetical protein